MFKSVFRMFAVTVALALSTGCASSHGALAFDQLKFPVSSSAYVYAPDDRPITTNELEQVGRLSLVDRVWGLFWGLIPLSGTVDVSTAMNEQISRAGGDGVINLEVRSENCNMNYVPVLNLLPIYPGCTLVTIAGDIVRLATKVSPAARARGEEGVEDARGRGRRRRGRSGGMPLAGPYPARVATARACAGAGHCR